MDTVKPVGSFSSMGTEAIWAILGLPSSPMYAL